MTTKTNRLARREFLGFALVAATGLASTSLISAPAIAAPRGPGRRAIAFHHTHTGESIDLVYWADGKYLPDATHRITRVLRDFRNNDMHPIDPKLLDTLAALRAKLRTNAPYMVIGGYRSPETNEMLRATTEGVAGNSLHMVGKAIDLRLPDRSLVTVKRAATAMKLGGVGYYPSSDFVHVDVGPVRKW